MTRDLGLEQLRAAVANASVRVPAVSDWSIGMHIHHCCLAMLGICGSLEGSAPPPPSSGFSLLRSLILTSGRIPRGRGKSPDVAMPRRDVSAPELDGYLEQAERALSEARDLDPQTWFRHFAFGVLPRDKALRFIRIHNRHHLRIISDIVGKGGRGMASR